MNLQQPQIQKRAILIVVVVMAILAIDAIWIGAWTWDYFVENAGLEQTPDAVHRAPEII